MTCIVGYSDGKNVWMASDTLVAFEDGQKVTSPQHKIIKRHDVLIGLAGDSILFSLLKNKFTFPQVKRIDEKNIFNKVVIPFRNLVIRASLLKEDATMDGELLIGAGGKIWQIATDFDIIQLSEKEFHAIGSGSNYALGAMQGIKETLTDFEMEKIWILEKGLEVAEYYQASVKRPFIWEKV